MSRKGIIFVSVVIVVIALGFYIALQDKSYDYYYKAKELYDQGKYRQAHDLLETGLSKNPLNRKIISLKGKVYPIVEGEENLKEAQKLYDQAINLALEGKIPDAKLAMSRAYELVNKVSSSSLVKDEADELIRKIERDSTLVLENAPDTRYKNALKLESEGQLVRAFEALNNIDVQSEKVIRKKSDIAFRLGERRYSSLKGSSAANEHFVQDALYWYSQVQPFDERYETAMARINELKLMKTK